MTRGDAAGAGFSQEIATVCGWARRPGDGPQRLAGSRGLTVVPGDLDEEPPGALAADCVIVPCRRRLPEECSDGTTHG
jgi:hypothetical protein